MSYVFSVEINSKIYTTKKYYSVREFLYLHEMNDKSVLDNVKIYSSPIDYGILITIIFRDFQSFFSYKKNFFINNKNVIIKKTYWFYYYNFYNLFLDKNQNFTETDHSEQEMYDNTYYNDIFNDKTKNIIINYGL